MQSFLVDGKISKQGSNAIKGMAILFMVIHHTVLRLGDTYTALLPSIAVDALGGALRMCVPLFVFVSGYGLMRTNVQTRQQIVKRLFSVFKIYVLCVGIVFIGRYCFGDPVEWNGWRVFIGNITGLHKVVTGWESGWLTSWWYIPVAYLLILIAPLWTQWTKRYGWNMFIATLILPILLNAKYDGADLMLPWLPVYTLGMLCADRNLTPRQVSHPVLTGLLAFLGMFGLHYFLVKLSGFSLFYRFSFCLPFALYFIYVVCQSKVLMRLLVGFGKISFPLYLVHNLFLNQSFIMDLSQYHWLLPSMVALILSVPIGIVVTRIGGKIKCPKQLL